MKAKCDGSKFLIGKDPGSGCGSSGLLGLGLGCSAARGYLYGAVANQMQSVQSKYVYGRIVENSSLFNADELEWAEVVS
ncbi:MAG: hypothetical protein NC517_00600 [Firmicutes bacterium]|nr:hypothetical protein [Bacillota bacterium]